VQHCWISSTGFCRQCGQQRIRGKLYICDARPQGRCAYLGEPTGSFGLELCKTCAGNVRIKVPLFSCQVYGTCVLADCVNCVAHSAKSCNDPDKPQTAAG
jgi:hypothetical protein